MFNKRLFTAIFAVGILSASIVPTVANAGTTIYNNLPGSGAASGGVIPFSYVGAGGVQANSFSVAAGSPGVESVSLYLNSTGNHIGAGTLSVSLVKDNAGLPTGATLGLLGTLLESALDTTLRVYTFNGFAPIAVGAGRYWINVVDSAGAASVAQWSYATDATGVGTAGEFNYESVDGVFANGPGAGPYQMQVKVPEPGTLALLSLGLAGVAFGKKRRKIF